MRTLQNKKKWLSIFMVLVLSFTMLGINLSFTYASEIDANLTSPTSRQVIAPGSIVEISGTAQGLAEVSVVVRNEQDSLIFTAQPIVNNGIFSTSFTLDADAAEGEYTIYLSGLGLSMVKERVFIVNNTEVVINLTSPSAGAEFKAGESVQITGTADNAENIYLCVRNSKNGRVYVAQPAVENNSFSCGFTLPAEAVAGEYTIYVSGYGMTAPYTSGFTVKSSESGGSGGGSGGSGEDILTVKGNGVANTVSYSLEELQQLEQMRTVLSVTSDRPEDLDMAVEGIPLRTLLDNAGINWGRAKLITFRGTDGYSADFTVAELFDQPRYIFPSQTEVEPIIALLRAERSSDYGDMDDDDIPVMVYGQRAATEQTLLWFVKRLSSITVSTNTPDKWAPPTALIVTPDSSTKVATQGGEVPSGSLIYLKHSSAVPKIYYTTDGSNPDMDSDIFNLHGCGPEQGVEEPIEITGPTTIKAVAIGRGKNNSNVLSLNFTAAGTVPGGGGSGGTPETVAVDEDNVSSESLSLENGRTGVRLTLQAGTLTDIENSAQGNRLTINSTDDVDEIQTEFPADVLQKAKEKGMLLGIDSQIGSYTLPLNTINLEETAASLGAKAEDLKLNITISKADETVKNQLLNQVQEGQEMLVDPIQFTVEFIAPNGKKIEHKYFGGTYVERELVLNEVNARQAVGVVWNEAKDKFLPVPTLFENRDGKQYAILLSRSNSLYTVLQSSKTFADIQDSWAKSDIELLSNKMLISGKSETTYEPNSNITRAEFATLLVRALGLQEGVLKEGQFKDVKDTAWYAGSVAAAVDDNIIAGYEGQLFKPENNITREEMAAMIIRAARVAGIQNDLTAAEQEECLAKFGDHQAISSWAGKDVAQAAKAGIISGMIDGNFSPQTNADRAQSASILKRFLLSVNFIQVE